MLRFFPHLELAILVLVVLLFAGVVLIVYLKRKLDSIPYEITEE